MKLTPDQVWFESQIRNIGGVPDTKGPYKFVFEVDSSYAVELTKFYAREFDIIKHGGGWWKHKTRNLIALLTGYTSRPGKLYVSAKPE